MHKGEKLDIIEAISFPQFRSTEMVPQEKLPQALSWHLVNLWQVLTFILSINIYKTTYSKYYRNWTQNKDKPFLKTWHSNADNPAGK